MPPLCPVCGEDRKLQAHHHEGYERETWLIVSFACDRCHRIEHRGRRSPKSEHVRLPDPPKASIALPTSRALLAVYVAASVLSAWTSWPVMP